MPRFGEALLSRLGFCFSLARLLALHQPIRRRLRNQRHHHTEGHHQGEREVVIAEHSDQRRHRCAKSELRRPQQRGRRARRIGMPGQCQRRRIGDGQTHRSFVNGVLEKEAPIAYVPQGTGRSSVGVRINHVSYFKGAVMRARFAPRALAPSEFMKVPASLVTAP